MPSLRILADHTITSNSHKLAASYPAQVRPYEALAKDRLSVRLPDRRRPIGSLERRMSQPFLSPASMCCVLVSYCT